ncbi:hypothetical protein BP5796_07697 [Coleophoma crateriformis]|uniref:Beta-lactamase-related domain-containing protein n=1 Tax=Coleophoma crateriformis TaxID=565419 RepID=A0A3D8RC79_9HELO|nr:hypothetical protein BP5796_07697 [Coleophoma crateriformis]
MALSRFEEALKKAIDEKVVGNAVVVASSKDGNLRYEKAIGKLSFEDGAPDVQLDTMITSVAVMQCVERGQVTLDEPVSTILPEWTSPDILTGIDPKTNEFISTKATTPITLRHLLTHTSGMGYSFSDPLIEEWIQRHPEIPQNGNVKEGFLFPLTFEPGTPGKWQYSVGIDWAGQVVERVNGGIPLGEYFEKHIFAPLGITSGTFHPLQREDIKDRLCPRMRRQEDGTLIMDTTDAYPVIDPVHDSGGGGLYATATDYHKILESIVQNDGRLLKEPSIDEMFRPQLPDNESLQKRLCRAAYAPVIASGVPGGSSAVKWNHCLAGLVAPEGVPGVAAKGTIWWDGMANTIWFMDRETGTCAFYGSQVLPFGDKLTDALFIKLQEDLYNATSRT